MKLRVALSLVAIGANLLGTHGAAHAASGVTAAERTSACPAARWTGTATFKGGTANGEEITVLMNLDAATYRIAIDASRDAARRGTVRSGTLLRDIGECAYLLSGENRAPVGLSRQGVLLGRIASAEAKAAPIAFIAFRETSARMSDLAGHWRVSGRERAVNAALPSKPIEVYEMRVQPDGRFAQCPIAVPLRHGRCAASGGRFTSQGGVFRLQEDGAGNTSLILGKVGDAFVPILLKRDPAGQGLRIFKARRQLRPG